MSYNLTDEQYARTRLSHSPLSILSKKPPSLALTSTTKDTKQMPVLSLEAYKNIQTVVSQLIIMIVKDSNIPIERIAEVIRIEATNIESVGLEYAYKIVAENTADDGKIEIEVELEEELEGNQSANN